MSEKNAKSSLKAAAELARRNKGSRLKVTDEVIEIERITKQVVELVFDGDKAIYDSSAARTNTIYENYQESLPVEEEERLTFLNPNPGIKITIEKPDCAHEIMKANTEALINEYRSKLDRFLIINAGTKLEESTFQHFHNDTSLQLLNKYDQLNKPGNLAFQSGYREVLEESFIAMLAAALANHKNQADPKPTKFCKMLVLVLLVVALISFGIYLAIVYLPNISNENPTTKNEFDLNGNLETSTFAFTEVDTLTTTTTNIVRIFSTSKPNTNTKPMAYEGMLDDVKKQLAHLYEKEFQGVNLKKYNDSIIPPEISLQFHKIAAQAAISEFALLQNFSPISSRFRAESELFLNQLYRNKTAKIAIIGIHLGQKYSVSAVYLGGKVETIPHYDHPGAEYNNISSYIGVGDLEGCIGQCAKNMLDAGGKKSELVINASFIWKSSTYPNSTITVKGQQYSVEDILARLLLKIRENAETYIGWPVQNCFITFSGFLFSEYSSIILNAALKAGFPKASALHQEPVAGLALAYKRESFALNTKWVKADVETQTFEIGQIIDTGFLSCSAKLSESGKVIEVKVLKYFKNKLHESLKKLGVSWYTFQTESYSENVLKQNVKKAVDMMTRERSTAAYVSYFFEDQNITVGITQEHFQKLAVDSFYDDLKALKCCIKGRSTMEGVIYGADLIGLSKSNVMATFSFGGESTTYGNLDFDDVNAYGAALKGAQTLGNMGRS